MHSRKYIKIFMKKYVTCRLIHTIALGLLIYTTIGHAVHSQNPILTYAGKCYIGGLLDSTRSTSTFVLPYDVTVDKKGNVYVVEYGNHVIRKIDINGNVSTIAGSGNPGNQDGKGRSASFNYPTSIAVDKIGNLYVADQSNRLIRRIDTLGFVTTIAGNGSIGNVDGVGKDASFNTPVGIAVDTTTGNIYVSDSYNHNIRKISKNGTVSTIAANSSQELPAQPFGITVDNKGNIYVADNGYSLIRKIDSSGNVSTLAGSGNSGHDDGVGSVATFHSPTDLAVDKNGNILVVDAHNNMIRIINPEGNVSSLFGFSGINGATNSCMPGLNGPIGITIDDSNNLFIADTDNRIIRKIVTNKITSIEESLKSSNSIIFPNPAENRVTVTISGIKELCIVDMMGHIVLKSQVEGIQEVTLESLKTGLYFYFLDEKMGKLEIIR